MELGRLMGTPTHSLDAPAWTNTVNCVCDMREDRVQLTDSAHKILFCAAHVVMPTLPLTAEDKFGTLDWSTAQWVDSVLGAVHNWLSKGMEEA